MAQSNLTGTDANVQRKNFIFVVDHHIEFEYLEGEIFFVGLAHALVVDEIQLYCNHCLQNNVHDQEVYIGDVSWRLSSFPEVNNILQTTFRNANYASFEEEP